MTDERSVKIFLWSIGAFVVLIIGGLGWALTMGPSQTVVGAPEKDLAFNDDNAPAVGPADAKVVVRMFGDFECPACKAAEPMVQSTMKAYQDRVRFVWDDFPLISVHPHAYDGAKAARCAQEQGKFWEFHDKLYETQDTWVPAKETITALQDVAQSIGMNVPAFTICYSDDRYAYKVRADLSEGEGNRVQATPTFFVNQTRYEGVLSEAKWKAILDDALKATGS